jgi:hypothetical protein
VLGQVLELDVLRLLRQVAVQSHLQVVQDHKLHLEVAARKPHLVITVHNHPAAVVARQLAETYQTVISSV